MRKTILNKSILIALVCAAGSASAASTDFSLHGYVKSGLMVTSDGTRAVSLAPLSYGKWRLGNEGDLKVDFSPTVTITSDDGVIARVRADFSHESTDCSADWNCVDSDGHEIQVREGFVELANMPFAPEVVFWAGKRYGATESSNHAYDWQYIQHNGTGGGVNNVDIGFARLEVGVYAFTPSGDKVEPADGSKQGYPEDYSVNMWLKGIAGTGLDLQASAHRMEQSSDRSEMAEGGLGLAAVYNFDGFYNVAGGYSKVVFQYGQGLAGGDSLGKNGWGWANSKGTKSWRGILDGMVSFANIDINTFAFYQRDKDYKPWANAAEGTGDNRSLWSIGARPFHQITDHFAMQYELAYEYLDNETSGVKGGMTKATIAPTLTFASGFWGRPQLRVFATYATWDKEISGLFDDSYTRDGKSDTLNFGVQGEIWF